MATEYYPLLATLEVELINLLVPLPIQLAL